MLPKKYFPQDKNYLLKEAQASLQAALHQQAIHLIKEQFERQFNPLGLRDDFMLQLEKIRVTDYSFLEPSYEILCAIYRYQYGDNQLEFLWDGSTHEEKYRKDWTDNYLRWIVALSVRKPAFTRAIIKYIFIDGHRTNKIFIERSLNQVILDFFGFKIYRKKGLVARQIA